MVRNRRVQHGTYAGFQQHQARGQEPCDRCAAAALDYHAEWRARAGESQERRLARKRAEHRAKTQLARRHQAEYYQLLTAELDPASGQVAV